MSVHDPEKACPALDAGWEPVSRLREALARSCGVEECFGGRRQVGKDHAQSEKAGLFRRLVPRTGAPIAFTIDGVAAEAREGDLLLTAILLHRAALRRFEFGDTPRAGFCLMAACQDCWVTLADGRRVRACSTLVEPGMAVIIDGAGRG